MRALNNAITAIALLLAALLTFSGLKDGWLIRGVDMQLIVLIAFWGGLAYFAWRWYSKRQAYTAAPEHAFKVNVVVEPMQGDGLANVIRGRKLTHILKIDVQISLKDWKRIKDAGMFDAVLFEYANTNSTYESERMTCHVRELRQPIGVSFYNVNDAEHAKEKLIEGLYNLRDAIEAQKEKPVPERLEI